MSLTYNTTRISGIDARIMIDVRKKPITYDLKCNQCCKCGIDRGITHVGTEVVYHLHNN